MLWFNLKEKKEEIWLSTMTKAHTLTEKPQKQRDNTKMPPKTLIKQRLWTDLGRPVGGNVSDSIGVVNPVYGIPLYAKAV